MKDNNPSFSYSKIIDRFVTAPLLNNPNDCRQGVVIEAYPDKLIVRGMLDTYECGPSATIVPLSNLWGEAREFAIYNGVKE